MCVFTYDDSGLDPKQAYFLYDTYGKQSCQLYKCNDPILVQRIIWGKQLTNMTIKMWVEDIKLGNLFKFEIEEELAKMPDWCRKSLENALSKF